MIRESLDCDGEVEGKKANFFLPCVFPGTFDLKQLHPGSDVCCCFDGSFCSCS